MRSLPFIASLSLFGMVGVVAATPSASADHCCIGCTHEWAEIGIAAAFELAQGDPKGAAFVTTSGAKGCLAWTGDEVCRIVRCD